MQQQNIALIFELLLMKYNQTGYSCHESGNVDVPGQRPRELRRTEMRCICILWRRHAKLF